MTKHTLSILAFSLGLMLAAPWAVADDAPQPLTVSTAPASGQTHTADDDGLCTVVCPLPG